MPKGYETPDDYDRSNDPIEYGTYLRISKEMEDKRKELELQLQRFYPLMDAAILAEDVAELARLLKEFSTESRTIISLYEREHRLCVDVGFEAEYIEDVLEAIEDKKVQLARRFTPYNRALKRLQGSNTEQDL